MAAIILLLLAFICFVLAAAQAPFPRVTPPGPYYHWVGLGLAFWVLTELLPHLQASSR
jgi:hypothetical protein